MPHILFSAPIKLSSILRFIVYSNLWIALAAPSLTFFFYRVNFLKPDPIVLTFTFFSTLFIYNFQRLVKLKMSTAFSGQRLIWMQTNLLVSKIMTAFGLISSLILIFLLDLHTFFVLIPAGVIALFYSGNFILKSSGGLRDLPFLKAYFVSLSWASVTVFLPALHHHFENTNAIIVTGTAVFLFVFSMAIVFDLRDLNVDEKTKRTVPQLFGSTATLVLSLICLVFSMLFPLLINHKVLAISIITILIGTILISRLTKEKPDLFYSFWLDGLLLIPGILSFFIL